MEVCDHSVLSKKTLLEDEVEVAEPSFSRVLLAWCWVWDGRERYAGSWEGIALAQGGDDSGHVRVIVVETDILSTCMSCDVCAMH